MSCFIVCWLPFFIMQLFFAVFKDLSFTHYLVASPLATILLWLGYVNSLLNPVIYTIFSPDFRGAFSKILFGKYRRHRKTLF
jgi:5-hydroxytryptamine receptor 1